MTSGFKYCLRVPAELCQQVLAVVRGLAKGAPLRSAALTGGRPWRTQREALDQVSRYTRT